MKKTIRKKLTRAPEFQKNLQLNIKPVQNTRTNIRQFLRSFIPLHSPEEGEDIDPVKQLKYGQIGLDKNNSLTANSSLDYVLVGQLWPTRVGSKDVFSYTKISLPSLRPGTLLGTRKV
ncbi:MULTISPECIES: hypothetical protein [Olivibacter]|uniref:Uncharacterized protein n=1 Tax=Olivibacter jilunii TaxID=985016 RepID=A0ABW6B965_9SPHI|nr:hypothetical protein [Pseudosphingobacterium sp.]